jgi:branched-subunit amino acid transport protein
MSVLPVVAGMALVTYLCRIAGLWMAATVPPAVARSLRLVPVAVFAALAVPAVPGPGTAETASRVLAAGVAVVATRVSHRLWLGIAVGMLALWALR